MRLYLSTNEAGVLIGSLVMAYAHADANDRTNIDNLLKRIDVCLTLQGKPKQDNEGKPEQENGGKKSKKTKKG